MDDVGVFGIGADKPAQAWRSVIRQLVVQGFLRVDPSRFGALVLTESSRGLVRAAGGVDMPVGTAVEWVPWTPLANVSGQPAISLPLAWSPSGLPIGMMFTAAFGREDLLIRIARQLELAQPWGHRTPPVFARENP